MSRRTALAALLSTPLTLLPATSFADPIFWGARLAQQDKAGGGTAPPPKTPTTPSAPTATIADVAGEPTKVGLPELLQTTVRQSPALATARIDIEVAEAAIEQSRGLDDWRVGAALTGTWQEDGEPPRSGQFVDAERTLSYGASANLSKQFSTGGTLQLHAGTGAARSESTALLPIPGFRETETFHSDELWARFTQPLLRGRGKDVARAAQAQARISRDAVVLDQRRVAIQQVSTVVQGYWDLVMGLRQLEIQRSSLELARERLRLTQAGINGGRVAPSEALAVEQAIATREEAILGAELSVLNQSITLRRSAGLEVAPGKLGLITDTQLAVPATTWDLPALFAAAQQNSPELAVLAMRAKGATLEVEVTENGLLPSLDASLQVGTSAGSNRPSDAFIDTASFQGVGITGSLVYQQDLGNHALRGQARRARAERERVTVNIDDVNRQINQAIAVAVAQVRSAEQRVALGTRAVALAEQNIGVEQSRFNLGKSTNFDVLLRQDELRTAQLNQARAVIDWHKAQAVIQSLTGDLLPTYGIELRETTAKK